MNTTQQGNEARKEMLQKIDEGDFAIAKFLDYDYLNMQNEVWKVSRWELHDYHSSWDLLMPVVEKIEALTGVQIFIKGCSVEIFWMGFKKTSTTASTKIESVWQSCIQFITWYNHPTTQNQ